MTATFDYDRGALVDLIGDGVRNCARHVIEAHHHLVRDDDSDEWVSIPVRAVVVDAAGPAVELGPFSLSAPDARLLADSLRLLADLAEGTTR